jgi:hypothetical protein
VASGSSPKNSKTQRKNHLFLNHKEAKKKVAQLHPKEVAALKDLNQPPKSLQPKRARKSDDD